MEDLRAGESDENSACRAGLHCSVKVFDVVSSS